MLKMPEESVKAQISVSKMGAVLPFFRFLLRERVLMVITDLFRIKSKADFTLRKSLYILVKFCLLRLWVIAWAKILPGDCKKERFVS